MTTDEMLRWIKTAAYPDLLRLWRHEPPGSPWFKGAVGTTFNKRMQVCREKLTIEQAVAISKQVGWTKQINNRDFKDE